MRALAPDFTENTPAALVLAFDDKGTRHLLSLLTAVGSLKARGSGFADRGVYIDGRQELLSSLQVAGSYRGIVM